jgi:signal transduction histidine kinase/CheY-like chemotaxis protein
LETRYLTFIYAPTFGDDGRIAGIFCEGFDVTDGHDARDRLRELNQTLEDRVAEALAEREAAEAHLRKAQKIEAIGQLTGGIAHDFNNLLTVISAGLSILDRQIDPQRRQRTLDGMRQATERGAALSRQLLAFSRRQPLQAEPVDLQRHLDDLQEMLDRTLRGDVQVTAEMADGLWPILVDRAELELVILNLCVNARDAMPDGGMIRIKAENVRNARIGDRTGDFVAVSIADTGVGMSPDTLQHVFEPFFTTKDIGEGSGLGLAQVHGFAHQSGGSVEIESTVGRGTVVTLFLPRSASEAAVDPLPLVDRPGVHKNGPRRGTILLVEDDDDVAAVVGEMLTELGYGFVRAASSEDALTALADGRPVDLVFSDIMMPGGMNGLDLIREVRRRHPRLAALLTSGYADAAVRQAAVERISVLAKPYAMQTLERALDLAFADPGQ